MKYAALLLAAVVGLACSRSREASTTTSKPPDAHAGESKAEREEEASKKASVVRIEATMLRDLSVTTSAAERRPGAESSPVVAELRVAEQGYAEVSAPTPGRVLRVAVTAGQRVARGEVLAEIQSQELGKIRGEYRDALARVELSRKTLERKRALAEDRIAPLREVQEAEASLRSAEASLEAARSALQAMGTGPAEVEEGSALRLRAPIAGTVLERNLAQGQVVEAAQPLVRLGDLSRLWLVAHAPERDAVRVASGSQARVAIPAFPGQSFTARVQVVGSQVEVGSRTIPVRLEVANPGAKLRPGMSATVWLPVGEGADVIAVPAAALQRLDDKWCVFVPQKEEGVFEVRTVGRGRDLGGEVEIVSGVAAGETIVVEGAFLLKAEAEKARGGAGQHAH
jgi:cobalt-zinc-cadmium efflux system membrane fusion protein